MLINSGEYKYDFTASEVEKQTKPTDDQFHPTRSKNQHKIHEREFSQYTILSEPESA